uniref:Uncharacterized protein n=1 Tax=Loa loa TaxID=7209 RepID=A0A1I7V712_LOALO
MESEKFSTKEKEMKQMEVEDTQQSTTITISKSLKKPSEKKMKIVDEVQIQKQPSNLENVKVNNEEKKENTDKTQCSQSETMQNVDEITEDEKKTLEVNTSREVSSHDTLQHVQPRVRFFDRAKEIEQSAPVDRKRHEYKTMIIVDENKNLIAENICPREVNFNSF